MTQQKREQRLHEIHATSLSHASVELLDTTGVLDHMVVADHAVSRLPDDLVTGHHHSELI